MPASGWLADTRASYDSVAVSHADHVRDALAGCTVEAQMPLDVGGSAPGAVLFARATGTAAGEGGPGQTVSR
jgi:hypothetical protein